MAYPRRSFLWPVLSNWVAVLFVIFWLSMTIRGGVELWRSAEALERRGVEVEGTITRLWIEKSEGSTIHLGAYAFDAKGQVFTGEATVEKDDWQALEVGGKVLVRYLPDDPRISASLLRRDVIQLDGGRTIGAVILLVLFAGGLAFPVSIVVGFNGIRRQFWLRDNGLILQARVLTCAQDEGCWDITWRDETGVEGKATGIAGKICPEVGATITVFAHPTARWRTVWEGEVGSRVT